MSGAEHKHGGRGRGKGTGRPGSELCSPCVDMALLHWRGREAHRDVAVGASRVTRKRMRGGSPREPGGEIKLALTALDLGKVVICRARSELEGCWTKQHGEAEGVTSSSH